MDFDNLANIFIKEFPYFAFGNLWEKRPVADFCKEALINHYVIDDITWSRVEEKLAPHINISNLSGYYCKQENGEIVNQLLMVVIKNSLPQYKIEDCL